MYLFDTAVKHLRHDSELFSVFVTLLACTVMYLFAKDLVNRICTNESTRCNIMSELKDC